FVRLQEIGPVPTEDSLADDDDAESADRMVETAGRDTGRVSGGMDDETDIRENGTASGREVDIRVPE
ncbi:MAG: hypothetical protein LIQ31_09505, partial [Planctomycetes bacterium]|nr:hypothetical protein [Planctomycetota bacterium]